MRELEQLTWDEVTTYVEVIKRQAEKVRHR